MDNYDEEIQKLKQFSSNPESLVNHVSENTEGLEDAAPNITQGLHTAVSNGVAFLSQKIPQGSDQLPMSYDFKPSRAQKAKFSRYFDAVNDPISVLDQIKKGTVSHEHMEALQAVHPDLLSDMQKKVMENMDPEKDKNLPRLVKISIAKFLGQPMDQNMTPQAILSNQMAFASQAQSPQSGQSLSRKTAVAGTKNWKQSQRAQTQIQKDVEDL